MTTTGNDRRLIQCHEECNVKKKAGSEQLSTYIHSKSTASVRELKKQFIFEEVTIEKKKPTSLGYCGQNKGCNTSSYSPTPASARRSQEDLFTFPYSWCKKRCWHWSFQVLLSPGGFWIFQFICPIEEKWPSSREVGEIPPAWLCPPDLVWRLYRLILLFCWFLKRGWIIDFLLHNLGFGLKHGNSPRFDSIFIFVVNNSNTLQFLEFISFLKNCLPYLLVFFFWFSYGELL